MRRALKWECQPQSTPMTTDVSGKVAAAKQHQSKGGIGAGAIVAIFIVLVLICCVGAWCVYAYRHSTSKSGLFLIDVSCSSNFRFKMLRSCKLLKMKELLWAKFLKKSPELTVVELSERMCCFQWYVEERPVIFFQGKEVGGFCFVQTSKNKLKMC